MILQRLRNLVPTLTLALALAGAMPAHAETVVPVHPAQDTNRPRVMQEAIAASQTAKPAPAGVFTSPRPLLPRAVSAPGISETTAGTPGYANAGLRREVFGFVNAGNLGDASYGYRSWNFSLLSTVAYFGLQVNSGDGTIVQSGTVWNVWNSSTTSSLVSAAHASGTRVVLSIVLQDFGNGTPQMCAGLTHAATTISQAIAQVKSHGVDGLNVDYEGLNGSCGTSDSNWARNHMTAFVQQLRAAMPAGNLSVDTYSAAAADPYNFFDIPGMGPAVDSFFVMAYDSDWSNYSRIGCSQYCLNPVSPTSGYYYNDTRAAREYSAAVAPGKVILGLPYYGRKACVAGTGPNQVPQSDFSSPSYSYASTAAQSDGVSGFVAHIDARDGSEEYDTWNAASFSCTRQQYWESATSMGAKYDVINNFNLAGAGLFTLDYAGSAPEAWNQIATHFTLVPGLPGAVAACPGDGSASISWTPSTGGVRFYQVTASPGGATIGTTGTFATLTGLTNGTAYSLTVTPHNDFGAGVAATADPITPGPILATSYLSWYDEASPGMNSDDVHIVNPGSATSTGCVMVAGVRVAPFSVAAGAAQATSFQPGDIGGPVAIQTLSGPAVAASQRVKYFQSFNEVPAVAATAASTGLWFPWFDRRSSPGFLSDNIHVVNPGKSPASVTVRIPGCSDQAATVTAGGFQVLTCAGGFGGPVSLTSDVPILASQRVQYYQSFNEVNAQPVTAASTSLLLTWFDRASSPAFLAASDNIHVVNPGAPGSAANVTVRIPGCPDQHATIGGGLYQVFTCAGGFGGPVTVTSSDLPVLADQRVQYGQSFNEVPATPASSAASSLHLSWFDRISDGGFLAGADNIHVVNPAASGDAMVTVTIPGCGSFPQVGIPPGGYRIFTCASGFGGPVTISAASGSVIASQRVQYYQSFNEVAATAP
ncbi:MAG: hypothetical protein NVS9B1_15890 [Candidatus Dormibacteraceae bacterium]